jgi:hypothetical protein
MAGEASAQREKQDQSIKARKKELFVEEQDLQTGPRKKLRDYLKETPAAPLSKNVKLSLWGSAVPVVLLFGIALLSQGNRSTAKAPDEMVIPAHAKPAPASLSVRGDDKPLAPVVDTKPGDRKGDMAANPEKPPQDKPKPKKKPKKGAKPKETVVVQNTEDDKAKGDEPKDKTDDKDKDNKSGDSKKKPKTGSSGSDSKDKMAATDEAKSKSATPEKPKQRAAPIFKKKKEKVFSYPKREGEKKADPNAGDDTP